jgi:hypothetical protein
MSKATEVVFVRVPAEMKAALIAQVEGQRKNRDWSRPEPTMNGLIIQYIIEGLEPGKPAASKARKAAKK